MQNKMLTRTVRSEDFGLGGSTFCVTCTSGGVCILGIEGGDSCGSNGYVIFSQTFFCLLEEKVGSQNGQEK